MEAVDWAGEKHRMWVITDEQLIENVVNIMKAQKILIADGHHRYETAVAYAKEMKAKGQKNFNHILINLVNLFDEGLVVLPTHRLVRNLRDFDFTRFLDRAAANFVITPIPVSGFKETSLKELIQKMRERGQTSPTFGLYGGNGNMYLLALKDQDLILKASDPDKSTAWRNLEVTILHTLLLENLLGIGARERASEEFLMYTREDLFAIEAVDSGQCQVSFLMNPPRVEEVIAVAQAGEKMPQKSTFFYPKVISGLVINKLGN